MLSVTMRYLGRAMRKAGSPIKVKLRLLLLEPELFFVNMAISPNVFGLPAASLLNTC